MIEEQEKKGRINSCNCGASKVLQVLLLKPKTSHPFKDSWTVFVAELLTNLYEYVINAYVCA
jgi:hypothetical protein